ncbi:MAG: polysaccharide ABC transporter ATP-binding protein [Flavobacteriales bacterium]|jgi:lipopolysaccharide transport system ATP-binding protein|nr:MAG: polysaccharide ABC transporter ATP-binding protein [Flavobacteriales bacterium]
MAAPIITVERLSKHYRLRTEAGPRYTALRDVIAERAKGLFSRRRPRATMEEFKALDEVSFTVEAGDRVGIIGRNGAGKSTLLKVLSRITEPTKGRVTIDGRVASLLEVGTGFHPELTGRENIFLNGAILGMSRAEIAARFDEIVAFAEVERFLDTPVKRYSSGMYVRLAFAVAAHLEPEILIVDEVLAVGDAAFQRKCLGKMESVAGEGRTVLFVSHQMDAVQRLCNKGLLLHQGRLAANGPMQEVIRHYLQRNAAAEAEFHFTAPPDGPAAHATSAVIEDGSGHPAPEVPIGAPWRVRVRFTVNRPLEGFVIALGVSTLLDLPIRTTWSKACALEPGRYEALFTSDGIHLTDGQYKLIIGLSEQGRTLHYLPGPATLSISDVSDLAGDSRIVNNRSGLLLNQMETAIQRIS